MSSLHVMLPSGMTVPCSRAKEVSGLSPLVAHPIFSCGTEKSQRSAAHKDTTQVRRTQHRQHSGSTRSFE